MKLNFIATLIFYLFANLAFADSNFHAVQLYDGNISISIPNNFKPVSENDSFSKFAEKNTKKKVSNWNKPKYVFIDKYHNNIIVDLKNKPDTNLNDYINHLVQFIKQQNDHATVLNKRNLTISSYPAILLKVKAPLPDSSILYSATLVTMIEGKRIEFLIFLNSRDYKNWNKIMDNVVQSIKIHSE